MDPDIPAISVLTIANTPTLKGGDRYLAPILVIMFLLGAAMLYQEIVKWRKNQTDLFRGRVGTKRLRH